MVNPAHVAPPANEPTPPILAEGQSHTDELYELSNQRGMADTVERVVEIIEGLEHDIRALKSKLDAVSEPALRFQVAFRSPSL